jgi:hypothetical protein
MTSPVSILLPAATASAGPVAWAADELRRALVQRGVAAEVAVAGAGLVVEVAGNGTEPSLTPPAPLPRVAEGLALYRAGDRIIAWGHDVRGQAYALTELADRARFAAGDDPFAGTFPLLERPSARIRSMARLFCSDVEDKAWFYDRQQWRDYLGMLAQNRFNRFSLTLGMGYNYPYHNPWITDVYFYFPYPFLLQVEGFDVAVAELSDEERDTNLDMLKFIGREARRRGLDFQLALWTQRYDFDDVPRANYTVTGVTDANLAPYCRKAITRLLTEVPEITGLTFRVHVEGGIAEGDYDFWREAFAGVADAGRPVEIDMHGKGLDHVTLDLARETGMPFTASPKYLAEHMGLAYHMSAIREREYPAAAASDREKLSTGSRKFLRYSYGDLLTKDKDYSVLYRIWPGTQRVLLWADPELAAGYGRSSMFAGSDGVEWCEPLSFKGRMGTGLPGGRFNYRQQGLPTRYDWEKYAYQYRVWGRLLYAPDAPRETWYRQLAAECGDAAPMCEAGLSFAGKVLPLVTLVHGPSASNNHYWPEIYSNLPLIEGTGPRAYTGDMDAPFRFGNAPAFDSELFANPRDYAALLLKGETSHRYTPLDAADWLEQLADGCEGEVLKAKARTAFGNPAVQRMLADVAICGGLARFFAEKLRASVWAELFIATKASRLIEPAIEHARRSVMAWEAIAAISQDLYQDDLTYGPQSWLRGSWHSRLPEIRAELLDLEALRGGGRHETVAPTPAVAAAIAAIETRRPVRGDPGTVEAAKRFDGGQSFRVWIAGPAAGEPVLHYRHVNQAERWQTLAMQRDGEGFAAEIPGEYTRSPFHLQYFVSLTRDGANLLCPGLRDNLANEPYFTALQN